MISSIISVLVIVLVFAGICPSKKPSNPHPLPPGPTPLPYVGCIIQMLLNQLLLKQPIFKWIEKLMEKFKTQILCIRLGPSTHVILVTSPELACEFLHKQDDIFISRPEILSAKLVSEGYLSAILAPYGDQWRKMRKVLHQHLLSSQSHRWLEPKRNEEADHLLSYICNQIAKQENVVDGALINIRIVSRQFCANLMTKIVFGTRLFGDGTEAGGSGEEEDAHLAALFTILKYLYAFCITDYFPRLRGKIDIDGHEKKTRKALEIIRKYQDPLVDERIRMWKQGARTETSDLLDALITHENPKLTPNEIKAQIIELMIATIDNPSNAVEWAMAEMINEPVLLERAVKELDHVVGRNRLVEERDLPQLNYLKACIKECFRLHPFAALNPPHVPIKNTTVAGYFIPKGSHVMLSRRGLGRNPDVWEEPLRFEPERHLTWEENQVVLSDDDLTMISFSTGKRGCPGVLLGSTITTMLLARMVQGFSWGLPCNLSSLDLAESNDEPCLAKPLMAVAKPRLPHHLYPKE